MQNEIKTWLGLNNINIKKCKTNLEHRPYLNYIRTINKSPINNFLKTMNLKNT